MIGIILASIVWTPSIFGYGGFFLRILRQPDSIVYRGISGLALLSGIANSLNIFFPLSPQLNTVIWLCGILLMTITFPKQILTQHFWLPITVFSLLFVSIASFGDPNYDSGLYYLQTIRWLTEHATPFGLANLHGRLGFNSSWYSIAAALEIPNLHHKSTFFINSLFAFFYGLEISKAVFSKNTIVNRFYALTTIPLLYMLYQGQTNSAAADFVVALLIFISIAIYLQQNLDAKNNLFPLSFVVAVFAITVKLSAFPLLIFPVLIYLRTKIIPLQSALVGFLLIPWLVRSILLSGCLIYPVEGTCLPVTWRVPEKDTLADASSIKRWARLPGSEPDLELTTNVWLKSWIANFVLKPEVSLFMILPALCLIVLVITPLRIPTIHLPAILVPTLGFVFWFFAAPDLRFGQGYFWSFPLIILALASEKLWMQITPKITWSLLLASLPLLILAFNHIAWPIIPSADYQTKSTVNGHSIYIVTESDQCWLSDLPCAPYYSSDLVIEHNTRFYFYKQSLASLRHYPTR